MICGGLHPIAPIEPSCVSVVDGCQLSGFSAAHPQGEGEPARETGLGGSWNGGAKNRVGVAAAWCELKAAFAGFHQSRKERERKG